MIHTQQYLSECFSYDGETGLLYKKYRPLSHFNSIRGMSISNSYAGKKTGYLNNDGYLTVGLNGKTVAAHRIIFMLAHDHCPAILDHIDGNKTNNRLSNLRKATTASNGYNRGKPINNTSGYKGVIWNKRCKKWQSQIAKNSKLIYLGCFQDKESAYAAYCKAAKELHGEFANFG